MKIDELKVTKNIVQLFPMQKLNKRNVMLVSVKLCTLVIQII